MNFIKRQTTSWCIAFILLYSLFLIVSTPLSIMQDKVQEYLLMYNVKIEKLEGGIFQGSIYLAGQDVAPAHVHWNVCYINLFNPLGVCINT